MNHPKHEDWVLYLYDEAKPRARTEMRAHLAECAECRARLEEWNASRQLLDRWQLPRMPHRTEAFQPVLNWALGLGCVALVAAGFLIGRLNFGSRAANQAQAQLLEKAKQELRAEFAQALREDVSKTAAATLSASAEQTQAMLVDFNQTVERRLQLEKEQRVAACLALKRDVDTLAVNADAGLQTTERQLAQLAGLHLAQTAPPQSH